MNLLTVTYINVSHLTVTLTTTNTFRSKEIPFRNYASEITSENRYRCVDLFASSCDKHRVTTERPPIFKKLTVHNVVQRIRNEANRPLLRAERGERSLSIYNNQQRKLLLMHDDPSVDRQWTIIARGACCVSLFMLENTTAPTSTITCYYFT